MAPSIVTTFRILTLALTINPITAFHHIQYPFTNTRKIDPEVKEFTTKLATKYPAYTFPQLSTHFSDTPPDGFNETFEQRYWIDTQYYKEGGPVILLDGGETSGEDRLPFLEQGIVKILAEATGGVGIIFEHRYYGESYLTKDLSRHSLSLLTTEEALADGAYFSENFPYSNHGLPSAVVSNSTPWIHYGGSYAGAKSAFTALLYPDQFAGSIGSSGVVYAVENFWQYSEPIRLSGEPLCINTIINAVEDIDAAIDRAGKDKAGNEIKSEEVAAIMEAFGLNQLGSVKDFVSLIATPLGHWQSRNWDMNLPGTQGWNRLCSNLTYRLSELEDERIDSLAERSQKAQLPLSTSYDALKQKLLDPSPVGITRREQGLRNYARYIRLYLNADWDGDNTVVSISKIQDRDAKAAYYADDSLDAVWRLWSYQVCLEWGYFHAAAPADHPTLLSRILDVPYYSEICELGYGFEPNHHPNTTRINQYGNFSLSVPNLLYVDGDQDPWLYVTIHSPIASPYANLSRPDLPYGDGILINEAWHHSDENGLPNLKDEPERIQKVHNQEIRAVKGWVKDFYKKKGKWMGKDEREEL